MTDLTTTQDINREESVDIQHYFYLAWHWLWLFLLAAVLAGAGAYLVSRQMTPIYESTTSLLVMEAPSSKGIDLSAVQTSQNLTKTYSDMLTNNALLGEVISRLSLPTTPDELVKTIKISPVASTQIIEMSVQDPNPAQAAQTANTLVQVFIDKVEGIQSGRYSASETALKNQLDSTEKMLKDLNTQKDAAATPAERERLAAQVLQYQQLDAQLLSQYEQARLAEIQASANVVQLNPALPGTIPVSPKLLQNTLIAALLGLLLAAGAVFGLDALDDSIHTPEDVSSRLNLPVLGVIFQHKIKAQPITMDEPRSPISESFRSLRTNIQYANVDEPLRSLIVTSAAPGEGKTTISANLAVVFAHNGKRVYYADADLRHPTVHKKMDIPNNTGFSHMIFNPSINPSVISQNGKVPGLNVITCGDLPPNPAELLGSKKMGLALEKLKADSDLVIFDTPPVLAVADPAVLAPIVDGVLLVVYPGKTTLRSARQALEQLNRVNARVIGVVLNGVRANGHSYSYYYRKGYYKYYGKGDGILKSL